MTTASASRCQTAALARTTIGLHVLVAVQRDHYWSGGPDANHEGLSLKVKSVSRPGRWGGDPGIPRCDLPCRSTKVQEIALDALLFDDTMAGVRPEARRRARPVVGRKSRTSACSSSPRSGAAEAKDALGFVRRSGRDGLRAGYAAEFHRVALRHDPVSPTLLLPKYRTRLHINWPIISRRHTDHDLDRATDSTRIKFFYKETPVGPMTR